MTPHEVLNRYWGYDSFRPLQLDIVNSILDGHDTLGLMPTGGGKSITFQVPALILPGLTLVVTPLISLMRDQVDNLKSREIQAAMLSSGLSRRERNTVYDKAKLGKIKLLYISPERLRSESFRLEMSQWDVSLIVVDEAHCISQWGYDFRPAYLNITILRKSFPDVPMLALTASATPAVQEDIMENLSFRPGYRKFARSFHRDNLNYVIRYSTDKEGRLVDALRAVPGSAIVYVRSRKSTAIFSDILNDAGICATYYHAGLDTSVKEERQKMWKDNLYRVIVATNAFGMGIDKPDVRMVVHLDIPPSLEEYYQEAGRAGRDGQRAYALLIASKYDKAKLTRNLNNAFPPRDFILKVYEKACVFMNVSVGDGYGKVYEFDTKRFCQTFQLNPDHVKGALRILNDAGYFDYNDEPTARARVQIMIRRDEFYTLRLEDSEQKVINALLRLYAGLFADYVYIEEEAIAKMENMEREEVYQTLLILKKKKIIDYIPKRELPYIFFPTSRETTKYVIIPRSVYEDRREQLKKRLDAINRFVFGTEVCRDTLLLEYFGESTVKDCGMCDVCVDKKREANLRSKTETQLRAEKERLKEHIVNCILRYPGLTIKALKTAMPRHEKEISSILKELILKGKLERQGDSLYVVKL